MATKVVLFDLGGVLIELGGVEMFGDWIGEELDEEVWRRWLACPWVRRFERGLCSPAEFAAGMVESWELSLPPAEFLEHFRAWPRGLFRGAEDLVGALAGSVQRACFSNTNAVHWDSQLDHETLKGLFDDYFLSHQIAMVKPDRDAFVHVVATLGVEAHEILFLDDNQINVEGARAAGLDAEKAVGLVEARRLLSARDLLR